MLHTIQFLQLACSLSAHQGCSPCSVHQGPVSPAVHWWWLQTHGQTLHLPPNPLVLAKSCMSYGIQIKPRLKHVHSQLRHELQHLYIQSASILCQAWFLCITWQFELYKQYMAVRGCNLRVLLCTSALKWHYYTYLRYTVQYYICVSIHEHITDARVDWWYKWTHDKGFDHARSVGLFLRLRPHPQHIYNC